LKKSAARPLVRDGQGLYGKKRKKIITFVEKQRKIKTTKTRKLDVV